MTMDRMLTTRNPKTIKGEKKGYATAILHLAPANRSGHNVCPFATDGCKSSCLNRAGRGGIDCADGSNRIQDARIRRTRLLFSDRDAFFADLRKDIKAFIRRCDRQGLTPCVRLNGTSDLPVETWGTMQEFPAVQFYDYCKSPRRMKDYLDGKMPSNYFLVFSRSEHNDGVCSNLLKRGANVAVVFDTRRGKPLPATYRGRRVIDGDLSDLRFLDPKGVVVGLRFKHLRRDDSSHNGFIVKVNLT
jgi:hypothetical protein